MTDKKQKAASETPKREIIPAAYIGVGGEKYRVRVPVVSVFLERAEGPTELCRSWDFTSLHQADMQLRRNTPTAPKGGGYDKHDFVVIWADGQTYKGRYDLSGDEHNPSIGSHIYTFLTWIASDPKAESLYSAEDRKGAGEMAVSHDLDQLRATLAPDDWPVVRDYSKNPIMDGERPLERVVYDTAEIKEEMNDTAEVSTPDEDEILGSQAVLVLNTLIGEAVDELEAIETYIMDCVGDIKSTTVREPLVTTIHEERMKGATTHTLLDIGQDLDHLHHLNTRRTDLIKQIKGHTLAKLRLMNDNDFTHGDASFQMAVLRPGVPYKMPEE
jgi:hypothetical protein